MKFSTCAATVLAVIGLALGASASPQLTGGGVGQWQQAQPRTALVLAQMASDQSETVYDLRMMLVGEALGRVRGEMRQRPHEVGSGGLLDLTYKLEGQHLTLDDGRIHVRVAILLDLAQFGGSGLAIVGELDGLLFPVPNSLGYCPVLPPGDKPASLRGGSSGAKGSRGGVPVLIDPSVAPDPFPGEFIGRYILY